MRKAGVTHRYLTFLGIPSLAFLLGLSLAQAQTVIDDGQNITVPGGQSAWNTAALYIGNTGVGALTITDGGIVNSTGVSTIGYQNGSRGTVTVDGIGSQWNLDDVAVGYFSTGTLVISDGGVVSIKNITIGNADDSDGTVTVTGSGSKLIIGVQATGIGHFGKGRLTISDGGVVTSRHTVIGELDTGAVTVTGAGSQWNNAEDVTVGYSDIGTLDVSNGGVVNSQSGIVGATSSSNGTVTVTGAGSQWNNSLSLFIGTRGVGEVTIAASGHVMAQTVTIASMSGSTGILAIGAEAGLAPVAPGVLQSATVEFGLGTGELTFNHTATDYVFDATLNGGADNTGGSGTGLVGNGLVDAIAGRTILNADHGDFTGTLQTSGGGILRVNGDMSGGAANILAGGTLEGNGIVGTTTNAGTIAPGASIGTFTIAGNYTGNGGVLAMETELGGDNSPTDRLIITGDVAGSTTVQVTNLGGLGAKTTNGIQIIQVGGVSPDDAFSLSGDYVTETGQQAVIGGAYAYTLQHGGMETATDGNWYLVSQLMDTPRYQPGVPLYEQYPAVMASLNTVSTLQQRVGNRYWSQGGANTASGTFGMWGRIEGSRTTSDPARSEAQAHRDIDLWKLQTGFDAVLRQNADGSMLVGGVNVSHGTAFAEIGSPYGRSKIDTTGTGIGASLTWYGASGFYVDAQAQTMWFDSDISSTTVGREMIKGNGGNGYALSLETGKRHQIGNGFSVTPQVQLVWSNVDFDSFTDPFGAHVSSGDSDSLRARLGASLDHETIWVAANGSKSRSHVYAIANLYNEFLNGTKVNVANVAFRTRDERLWAGIGLGGTYEWNDGRYAIYGNANLAGSTSNMSDSYALGGTLGFTAKW